jgi:sulfonate transport system substrate-binding protein
MRSWPLVLIAILTLSADAQNIKIAVNSTTIESAPAFAAAGSGVTIVPVGNGRIAMSQLLSGEVDACTGSETQALLNSVAEPGLRIIVTLAEAEYRIIARRSAGIFRVADLRGKKVAATVNTSSQYFLTTMLRTAKLSDSDINFVSLEGPEMPAALKKGDVDAVAMWEPHTQRSLEALGDEAVVLRDPSVYMERFNLNTTTKVLSDPARRRALVDYLRRILQASDRMTVDRAASQRAIAAQVSIPPELAARVWNQYRFPANLPGSLTKLLAEVEPWVAQMQNRPPRPAAALSALIDRSLLAEAARR